MQTVRKRNLISNDGVIWVAVAVTLLAVVIVNHYGMPQKWHAAIMWTGVAFVPPTITRRKRWKSWSFWALWAVCITLHLLLMWLIFELLLGKFVVIGMLYVVPFGAIEAFFLLIVFSKKPARSPSNLKSQT